MASGRTPYPRIVAGLPDLQDQIRMVDRLSSSTAQSEQSRWVGLGNLLGELYSQLQHQKQVTVYRCGKSPSTDGRRRR